MKRPTTPHRGHGLLALGRPMTRIAFAAPIVLGSFLAGCATTVADDTPLAPIDSGPLAAIRPQLKTDDEPFALVIRFTLKDTPEAAVRFESLANAANAGTIQEPGVIAYRFTREAQDPRRIVLFEEWTSFTALRRHFSHDYVKNFLGGVGELMDGPPELTVARPMHPPVR